jgi:hypothetical protein
MIKKLSLVAVSAAMAVSLSPLPLQAHEATYPSTVTLRRGSASFYGRVRSENKGCKKGRTVKVLQDFTHRNKPARLIGTAITTSTGDWKLTIDKKRGNYHARVKKAVRGGYGHTHHCKGAGSGPLHVR